MNKQSNTYTVIYIIIMVIVVGAALAITSLSLQDKQQANSDADKMKQILASVHITPATGEIKADFDRYITRQMVIDSSGNEVQGDAFSIDVATESKKEASLRRLPVYLCQKDGSTLYILPVYGAGLWGPIWGYVSINSNGSSIYGAYFAHQGETPGLGAEIDKTPFSDQFINKSLFKDNTFKPVAVVKAGQKPLNGEDYVDGISGGTITSKGVSDMLANCLTPYKAFLEKLKNE
ncbi:MAG: NADH:ubiquinone reductase (Na(+)-transporting) subunit C [Muribaculaceae bacterium]|nr:NADH:ubiquinone reductase (Na(+)-transporting) subunit C [Muribaculaceae bacterium]